VSGARVVLLARSAKNGRWAVIADALTRGGGTLTVDRRIKATTQFVAQWAGDADRNGDGSPLVTVTVGK
jgi:hypothetical protein